MIKHFIHCLATQVSLNDLESLHYFLSIEVTRRQDDLFFSPTWYAIIFLMCFHEGLEPIYIDLLPKHNLHNTNEDTVMPHAASYKSIVGEL